MIGFLPSDSDIFFVKLPNKNLITFINYNKKVKSNDVWRWS